MKLKDTIWYDTDSEPPKNWIWCKDGKYFKYNGDEWVESEMGGGGIFSKLESQKMLYVIEMPGVLYDDIQNDMAVHRYGLTQSETEISAGDLCIIRDPMYDYTAIAVVGDDLTYDERDYEGTGTFYIVKLYKAEE